MARAGALCLTTIETLYAKLERLYTSFNYTTSHIWNCDESGVQVGRLSGVTLLAKRDNKSIHSVELDQKEHLSVLSYINADGGCISNPYILKGTYFLQDYIVD